MAATKTSTKAPAKPVSPAKSVPAKSGPVKTPAKTSPAKSMAPAAKTAAKTAPAKTAPAKTAPAKTAPAKTAPAKTTAKVAPAKTTSKAAPAKAAATKAVASSKAAKSTRPAKATTPAETTTPAKATAVRKATKSAKTAGPTEPVGESDLTPADIAEIGKQLAAELSQMKAEYEVLIAEIDELQQGHTDGAGDDQADAGSKTFEREQEISIAANRFDLITQMEHAIERIAAGTYGYCEECGQPIPLVRLQAFPMATLDVGCKQREERH